MATTSSDELIIAEVLAAEEERLAAIHASDWDRLSDYLGSDLTYTHMSGVLENKAENIAALQARPRTYKRTNLHVRPYGDTAVMNGGLEVTMAALDDGTPQRELNGRVVQVWVKRNGSWQMVAFQATAVPSE